MSKMKVEMGTKTEYESYAEKLEHMLDTEAAKPAGERDDELIEECMDTILYFRERASQNCAAKPRAGRRWIKAAAACLLLAAAVLITAVVHPSRVSEASEGPLHLSADVYWEKDGIKLYFQPDSWEGIPFYTAVPGAPEVTPDPDPNQGVNNPNYTFFSEEEIRQHYGSRMLIPDMPEGYWLEKACFYENPPMVSLDLQYRCGLHKACVWGAFSLTGEGRPCSSLMGFQDLYTDVYEKRINGADCIFAIGKKRGSIAVITFDCDYYSIVGIRSIDTLEDIVYQMTKEISYDFD